MNIHTIEVGVTRAPAVLLPAAVDPAALLTDEERLRALLRVMSSKSVYDCISWCTEELTGRTRAALLAALRALVDPEDVARVEFVTYDGDDGNGPHWQQERFYLHRKDGTVARMEYPEVGEDDAFEDAYGRYVDLLDEYSALRPPLDGAHLIVDLTSGRFEESSRNIL
ncbi:hypothetical protein [Streptomyces sp. NPDC058758]|uniref:hypothetical protein n=1 Tax=Streptomyces sp. NPDC058758 TaxID=3346627 RepID=UPI003682F10B